MAGENKLSDKALKGFWGNPEKSRSPLLMERGFLFCEYQGGCELCFLLQVSRWPGAPVWLTLGKYPDMSLKQARESATSAVVGWLTNVIRVSRLDSG